MKIAIIMNHDLSGVIYHRGMQNKEIYDLDTIESVATALRSAGHHVEILDGNMFIIEKLTKFFNELKPYNAQGMVFNMAYGIQGDCRYTHIPSLMEMLGLPYIGSSPLGHTLALDKVITKQLIALANLPTPDYFVVSNAEENLPEVEFPVVVKPKMEAFSLGVRLVRNMAELKEEVKNLLDEFQQPVLVEKFIAGREFTVGVIGNKNPEALPVVEIDFNNNPNEIQRVENKMYQPCPKICPSNVLPDLAKELQRISIETFKALHLRDFARVDMRMDSANNIYVLEVNSMASFKRRGSLMKAAQVAGYEFNFFVNKILKIATDRYGF